MRPAGGRGPAGISGSLRVRLQAIRGLPGANRPPAPPGRPAGLDATNDQNLKAFGCSGHPLQFARAAGGNGSRWFDGSRGTTGTHGTAVGTTAVAWVPRTPERSNALVEKGDREHGSNAIKRGF